MKVEKHFTELALNELRKESSTDLYVVTATDKHMSGWGGAEGGKSKLGWICRFEDLDEIHNMALNRPEMIYVNYTKYKNHQPRNCKHFSYYLADNMNKYRG